MKKEMENGIIGPYDYPYKAPPVRSGQIPEFFEFVFSKKPTLEENFFARYYSTPEINRRDKSYTKPGILRVTGEPFVSYRAYYANSLKVIKIKTGEEISGGLQVFYDHATFVEILIAIKDIPPPDENFLTLLYDPRFLNEKKFLNHIRDNPRLLLNRDIAWMFITLMENANHYDKKIAREVTNLLKDHFIPLRHGGKRKIPAVTKYAREILIELATSLSKKCREEMIEVFYTGSKREGKLTDDDYEAITTHAKNIKDYRISVLSKDALEKLIFRPAAFVDGLLQCHLKVSERTLKSHITKEGS